MTDKEHIKQLEEATLKFMDEYIRRHPTSSMPEDEGIYMAYHDLQQVLKNKETTSEEGEIDGIKYTVIPPEAIAETNARIKRGMKEISKKRKPTEPVYTEDEMEKFLIWYHGTESPFGTKGYFKNAFNDYNSDDEN